MTNTMDDSSHRAPPIRAVDRVCDLLDLLQQCPNGAALTRVASGTGLAKSSALRYLSALEARQYVQRDSDTGLYRLGLAFRPDRSRYWQAAREKAYPFLVRLQDRFEETINLGLLDGTEIVHIEVIESARPVRLAANRNDRGSIHSTAIGKAVAAMLSERQVREMLALAGMPAFTHDTITDADKFLEELAHVRSVDFGLDDCENQPDGRCVAVPITEISLPAALSLSAPASRFPAEDAPRIAAQLHKVAVELSRHLRALPL